MSVNASKKSEFNVASIGESKSNMTCGVDNIKRIFREELRIELFLV